MHSRRVLEGILALLVATLLVLVQSACSKQGEPFEPARPGQLDSTKVEGNESGRWTARDDPYYVVKSVVVPAGKRLTIEPGVLVIFTRKGLDFTVRGELYAEGKPESLVTFRPNSGRGLPAVAGDWGSLEFEPGSVGVLDHVRVLYATTGITAEESRLDLAGCTINNHLFDGLVVTRSSLAMTDCTVANNGQHGLVLNDCDSPDYTAEILHCNIGNNRFSGIWGVNSSAHVTRSDVRNNGLDQNDQVRAFSAGAHFEGLPGLEPPVFRQCNLDANLPCDVRNLMTEGTISADSNFWGYTSTAQMNALSNPDPGDPEIVKENCAFNIPRICDALDSLGGNQPSVRFCEWLDDPVPNFSPTPIAPDWSPTPAGR